MTHAFFFAGNENRGLYTVAASQWRPSHGASAQPRPACALLPEGACGCGRKPTPRLPVGT